MEYELAHKLREHGFPQKTTGDFWHSYEGTDGKEYHYTFHLPSEDAEYDIDCDFAPDISDLLTALGEEFDSLHRSERSGGWMATNGRGIAGEGETAEIALSNLYLSLHSK